MGNETIDVSSIKALVSMDKLDEAVKQIISKGHQEKNIVLEQFGLHFSGRLKALSKTINHNSSSYSDQTQTRNNISARILDILLHYENGTLEKLKNTEEYRDLLTPEEEGRRDGDIQYFGFLQTLKRFWWFYFAFIIIAASLAFFMINKMIVKNREFEEHKAKIEESRRQ